MRGLEPCKECGISHWVARIQLAREIVAEGATLFFTPGADAHDETSISRIQFLNRVAHRLKEFLKETDSGWMQDTHQHDSWNMVVDDWCTKLFHRPECGPRVRKIIMRAARVSFCECEQYVENEADEDFDEPIDWSIGYPSRYGERPAVHDYGYQLTWRELKSYFDRPHSGVPYDRLAGIARVSLVDCEMDESHNPWDHISPTDESVALGIINKFIHTDSHEGRLLEPLRQKLAAQRIVRWFRRHSSCPTCHRIDAQIIHDTRKQFGKPERTRSLPHTKKNSQG